MWRDAFGARVICPPYHSARRNGPRKLQRWLAGHRQVIESVNVKLLHTVRLERGRPHALGGFHARLATKVALHNFCYWLNRQFGRPTLALTDLLAG